MWCKNLGSPTNEDGKTTVDEDAKSSPPDVWEMGYAEALASLKVGETLEIHTSDCEIDRPGDSCCTCEPQLITKTGGAKS